jgi:dihydropteroate synthase
MKSAAESNFFSRNYSLNIHGRLLDLRVPAVMGVINVTPDSFFEGSRVVDEQGIVDRADKMLTDGATILDVGAYSTRPGAGDVPEEEEIRRAVMAVKLISKKFPEAIISIDTFRHEVARAAVAEGASMINDVSGGELDPEMFHTVGELAVPYVLMHMRGTPQTMTALNEYDDLKKDVIYWLQGRLARLRDLDVKDVIIDPGFGFAKGPAQNFEMLGSLELFHALERPLLVGVSRKSMIWKTLATTADEALNGTTVLNTVALLKGASILRVHDVKEAVEAVKLIMKLKETIVTPV